MYNPNYGKYRGGYRESRGHNNTSYRDPKGEAALIKEHLNSRIKELAFELLGKPTSQTGREWRYGRKGSVSIHVAGFKQGLYSNFEEGTHGSALKLIQEHFGFDHKQAFKWGLGWLRHQEPVIGSLEPGKYKTLSQSNFETSKQQAAETWIPVFPIPSSKILTPGSKLPVPAWGRQEVARFAYKDAEENILGYVVRLEDRHGDKITPTLTYCRNEKGDHQWRWKGFGEDRPLYGLEQLAQKPHARILVVEGEKTAEVAKALFPDYAVVTWSGGCGAVSKSDWSVLKDRTVVIWPDNDKTGHNAAVKIKDILAEHGNPNTHLVPLPSTLPDKWDLADKLPEGFTHDHLKTFMEQKEPILSLQEPFSPEKQEISEGKIVTVAQKYALTDYLEPEDKTQNLHIHFAIQDFEKVNKHYKFESNPADLMEKAILTGIIQHFITTTQRTHLDLNEERLQESYDQATATASVLTHQLKTQDKLMSLNDAFAYAQEHLDKEDKAIQRHLKTLPPQDKPKERIRLKEKSRLQNQFRKELREEQSKQLTLDIAHHYDTVSEHAHDRFHCSFRQTLFGQNHNLTHFSYLIQQHQTQQQRIQETQALHPSPLTRHL